VALLCLQRIDEALQAVKALQAESESTDKEVHALSKDVARALQERQGNFDIEAMVKETGPLMVQSVSRRHADYESSDIELRDPGMGSKGRGFFARTTLQAGTLVLAAKAFVHAEMPRYSQDLNVSLDATSQRMDLGSQSIVISKAILELVANPERGQDLYSLRTGDAAFDDPARPSDTTRVDVPRIRAICQNNWFSTQSELSNLKEMRLIYQLGRPLTPEEEREHSVGKCSFQGSGLWIRPSLFNHSCLPNCVYQVVGDFMFVITSRLVKAGDELCIPYTDIHQPFPKRSRRFSSWNSGRGFECACPRCVECRCRPELVDIETEVYKARAAASKRFIAPNTPLEINTIISSSRRSQLARKLKALPTTCQAPLSVIYELDAKAKLSEGKCTAAATSFHNLLLAESHAFDAFGLTFLVIHARLHLVAAEWIQEDKASAIRELTALYKHVCCPPSGFLAKDDLGLLMKMGTGLDRATVDHLFSMLGKPFQRPKGKKPRQFSLKGSGHPVK